jgi:predicted MPP superfamily phosphohydrolase
MEFWRESNHEERERIIHQIAAEVPDFLAIVGDLVFRGSSAIDWAEFDELSLPLHSAAVPVLPVLGNHEYWFSRRSALAHFFARFPYLSGQHWYALSYGPLGLIFLNSNQRWLTRAQWQEQLGWYRRELELFDHRDDIQGVLVLLHHAPYTNSCLTSDPCMSSRFWFRPSCRQTKPWR